MTRLPPLLGRLSRNERALREAEQRQETWVHEQKRRAEHELRAQRQAEIDAIVSTPWFTELTLAEHRAIYSRIRGAKL